MKLLLLLTLVEVMVTIFQHSETSSTTVEYLLSKICLESLEKKKGVHQALRV